MTLSVVTDAILAFFNYPVARKDLKFKRTKLPFAQLTDRCANRLKAFDLLREDCSREPGTNYVNISQESKTVGYSEHVF